MLLTQGKLFGDNQTTVDTGTDQEPSIYEDPHGFYQKGEPPRLTTIKA